MRWWLVPDPLEVDRDLTFFRNRGDRLMNVLVELCDDHRIGAAHIKREAEFTRNDVARRARDLPLADRRHRVWCMRERQPLDRERDLSQRRQRVAAERHRRGAGMALEAGNVAVVPGDALA